MTNKEQLIAQVLLKTGKKFTQQELLTHVFISQVKT